MAIFDFNGEMYKKASNHQKEWGRGLIFELQLRGNEKILDLGCGDGVLTEKLSSLVPNGEVIGIDSSNGMIETAEKITKDNLKFICMDMNEMTFQNEFDVIFSNAALHWVKDHNRLLNAAYAALKASGVILWDFGGDGNCANFLNVISQVINEDRYSGYFEGFEYPWFMPSKEQYEQIISDIGFSDFTITEVNRDRYFSSADEMVRWIDQPCIVPFIANVPDNMKNAFREEVIEKMLEKTQQSDGTYFETFRRLKINAKKSP